MPFLRTTDRMWGANHLGYLGDATADAVGQTAGSAGSSTSDDIAKWLTVGGSVFSASAPLIQTFVPNSAQSQFQAFVNTITKNVNPVAGQAPQPAPPAIPMTPTVQPGMVIPTWAPWALLGAVGAFFVARQTGGSRRRNPTWGDPSAAYKGFAVNPRKRKRHRRMNPLTRRETADVLRTARADGQYSRRKGLTTGEKQWYRGRAEGGLMIASAYGASPLKHSPRVWRHRRILPRATRSGRMHYTSARWR